MLDCSWECAGPFVVAAVAVAVVVAVVADAVADAVAVGVGEVANGDRQVKLSFVLVLNNIPKCKGSMVTNVQCVNKINRVLVFVLQVLSLFMVPGRRNYS